MTSKRERALAKLAAIETPPGSLLAVSSIALPPELEGSNASALVQRAEVSQIAAAFIGALPLPDRAQRVERLAEKLSRLEDLTSSDLRIKNNG